uniref:Protein kinase domain-containing protein n=1 Tax=Steinernema glaseri TaxID=37863 RepID=A0A1I7YT63_9BILA
MVLRPPRAFVRFRGTLRFCSIAVHRNEEPGFADDIWSAFYTFVEMVTGDLPWRGMDRSKVEECKTTVGKDVMVGCPKDTVIIYKHLRKLNYFKTPDYKLIMDTFAGMVLKAKKGGTLKGPYDWEPKGAFYKHIRDRSERIAQAMGESTEDEIDEKVVVESTQPQTLQEARDVATEFGEEEDEGPSLTLQEARDVATEFGEEEDEGPSLVGGHSKEDSTFQDVDRHQHTSTMDV